MRDVVKDSPLGNREGTCATTHRAEGILQEEVALRERVGHFYATKAVFSYAFLVLFAPVTPTFSQTVDHQPSGEALVADEKGRDYPIGVGDVLNIAIVGAPESSGRFRVAATGSIMLPGLRQPIRADGLTAADLSKSIGEALKAAELLREPMVNVFVEQYHSRTISILGAVNRPGVYPLEKPTTLLEALSLAGGVAPAAGPTATILRRGPPPGTEGLAEADRAGFDNDWTQTVHLPKLMEGKDPSLNIELHPGDVVNVSTAPVVYVMGAVMRPGGFVLPDSRSGVTVLQALAMAAGLKPISGARRSFIIRRSASGNDRQEIPINVAKLMAGKLHDQALEPNDILFIPESGSRKALARVSEAAIGGLNTVAIYSGIRVATR